MTDTNCLLAESAYGDFCHQQSQSLQMVDDRDEDEVQEIALPRAESPQYKRLREQYPWSIDAQPMPMGLSAFARLLPGGYAPGRYVDIGLDPMSDMGIITLVLKQMYYVRVGTANPGEIRPIERGRNGRGQVKVVKQWPSFKLDDVPMFLSQCLAVAMEQTHRRFTLPELLTESMLESYGYKLTKIADSDDEGENKTGLKRSAMAPPPAMLTRSTSTTQNPSTKRTRF